MDQDQKPLDPRLPAFMQSESRLTMPPSCVRNDLHETTRLANLPLCIWAVVLALGGLCYYLDAYAPYRVVLGFSKERIEDYCLNLSAILAVAAILIGILALGSIYRSSGRLKGTYRTVISISLNLLTLIVVMLAILARGLVKSMV